MSTRELEQGTPEWFAARVGRITGSRVAGVLNCSPFTSRKRLLKEMVDEALGTFNQFDNKAMAWGRDNEGTAAKLYDFLYAGDSPSVETGFWERDCLGASPDRLVGVDGLVEIKCPYGIREDERPVFKEIESQPHYYHQMQMQMYVTDRHWCDFFQWTPHGHKCERVFRDVDWFRMHEQAFLDFLKEFDDLKDKMASGGPAERVGASARWAAAAEDYFLAARTEAAAKSDKEEAMKILKSLMEENSLEDCQGAGMKAMKILRKGTVDYQAMLRDVMPAEEVTEKSEDYRRKDSVAWTFKEADDAN